MIARPRQRKGPAARCRQIEGPGETRDHPGFDGDYRRLKREHAVAFKTVVREKFAPACDAYTKDPTTP